MKKTALAAAGLLAVGAVASLSASSASASSGWSTTHFKAYGTSFVTKANPSALKPGDTFTLTERLQQGKTTIGHDFVACTVVSKDFAQCTGTFRFDGRGDVEVAGLDPVGPQSADSFTVAVTGGTGHFTADGGTLTIAFNSSSTSKNPPANDTLVLTR